MCAIPKRPIDALSRCGLFWKALGIVCALFLGWQLVQFAIWMVKVSHIAGKHGLCGYSKHPFIAYAHWS